ncbi:MAG TPA: SDR family oxidoreductase [Pseudolysinimonas sp.]
MTGRLDGKAAIVSGAASGMGAAYARAIVREGGRVVIGDLDREGGEQLARDLGDAAVFSLLDVTDLDSWHRTVELAENAFGVLNVLVNNAGILDGGTLDDYTPEQWDRVMNVNAKGTFLGLKSSVAALRRGRPASVINVSSTAGLRGVSALHGYTASKFAIRGLTKSAALELADQGVRVNSVHPGRVATPMTHRQRDEGRFPGVSDESSLLARAADPTELVGVVIYLASDESSFATGAEFVVDGGMTAGDGRR